MMSRSQRFGLKGELWVQRQLQQRGHDVKVVSDWWHKYDMLVDGLLPVEVKIAMTYNRQVRPGYHRPTYAFETARLMTGQDYLIVLICQDDQRRLYPYITPSWIIGQRQMVSITSHPDRYRGRLATYLHNWSIIQTIITTRQRLKQSLQLPLFA